MFYAPAVPRKSRSLVGCSAQLAGAVFLAQRASPSQDHKHRTELPPAFPCHVTQVALRSPSDHTSVCELRNPLPHCTVASAHVTMAGSKCQGAEASSPISLSVRAAV